ncbi:phosphatidylserine/phosphatidylglycerophosphate/cardiolipin synthase family protein [Sulfitobacter aestuarii]|uniref:Phospholipase D n=1 Tax=Sulfitobacter aestuarii TaxID=2161676 RepID=A0ABW5TZT0_9RHOB
MMYWITTHLEIMIVVVLTLLAAVVILQQRRTPQSTAAWLLFIIALPWAAIPLFLGLGFRKHSPRAHEVAFCAGDTGGPPPTPAHPLDDTFQHFGLPAAAHGQKLTLLDNPQNAYEALLELIADAEERIEAVFYIVANDETGTAFVDALTARAESGVTVRLLMDRLGTGRGPAAALKRLRAAGGDVRFYSPLLQLPGSGHMNLRNHRKMLIVDGLRVFSGGMNIGLHYLSARPVTGGWGDLAFTLEGVAARSFADVFRSDWCVASGETLDPARPEAPDSGGSATVQLVPAGPDIREDPLHDGLIRALHMAEARIWIVTPYFVPTEQLGNALTIAARRGVDVRLLVPARSNQRLADFARGAYLREMHEAGGQVLYYQPGMIHAKAGLIDDLAFIGSANFDVRSMLLNFETMLFAYDAGTVADLADWFTALSADCRSEKPPSGMLRRVAEGVFRLGAPVL